MVKETEEIVELAKLSRVNVSFKGNTKGINVDITVYEGADEKIIDTVIGNAAYAFRSANMEAEKLRKAWVTSD